MKTDMKTTITDRVRKRLKEVIDPSTNMDVMTMGLIKNLEVNGEGDVSLKFRPSSPECPLVIPLAFRIREALEELEGIGKVSVTVIDHKMASAVTEMLNEKEETV